MRNIKTLKLYLITGLFACALSSSAQRFDSILSKLNSEYKQEKLYLHFDRSVYSPGETIWFKAYLFTGNFPSLISKNIYTELVDDKGKLLERKVAPVLSSSAAASFDLPPNITGQVVYVRAYTKWMLNFDSTFIFQKAIPLATLKKTNKEPVPATISVQFFPEGGDLVQELSSRVAFKATDATGIPANISGDIKDSKGNKIVSFTSIHDGMGSFELFPKAGETYKATWKDKTGKTSETPLPVAKQNGIVMEVNNTSFHIEFKVKRPANVPAPYPFVYIVAQMNQQLLYRAKANLTKTDIASAIIPIENLPAGIVQVTIFTPDEKPVAERITFINKSNSFFITDLNT
ncbi:MAG TPA: hypothetical protein VMY77_17045, partial [Chitinophagaceae bacterium]|nr:hypothetical protein [Chitinophagaceae bacterium]